MRNLVCVNEKVDVTAFAFGGTSEVKSYPRRMEYRGETYTFVELGLRCLVHSGKRLAQVFTVSDGISDYRLRYDDEGSSWTLLAISGRN
jgi:hypothetical protein